MIIEGLVNVIFKVLQGLLSFINIPDLSSDLKSSIYGYIDTVIDYGAPMLDFVIPYNVAKVLITIVVTIEVAIMLYKFIMWIITKIPMLNIQRQ